MSSFQSTLPLRGATNDASMSHVLVRISIHAPLAGSDDFVFLCRSQHFVISIHAPLAGSDYRDLQAAIDDVEFQSTLPLRGATNGNQDCGKND